jgi:hypothetical protein
LNTIATSPSVDVGMKNTYLIADIDEKDNLMDAK